MSYHMHEYHPCSDPTKGVFKLVLITTTKNMYINKIRENGTVVRALPGLDGAFLERNRDKGFN